MTRPDHTDVTILLDRSGSMDVIRQSTITGFNGFLAEQRQQSGSATISLIQFDHRYEPVYVGLALPEAVELTGAEKGERKRGHAKLLGAEKKL